MVVQVVTLKHGRREWSINLKKIIYNYSSALVVITIICLKKKGIFILITRFILISFFLDFKKTCPKFLFQSSPDFPWRISDAFTL